jgi:hypothetical protein
MGATADSDDDVIEDKDGFPAFQVAADAHPITNEMVRAALDEM